MHRIALPVLGVFLASSCHASQLTLDEGPQGQLNRVRAGGTVFLADAAISVVKPGWDGKWLDQRDATPIRSQIRGASGNETVTVEYGIERGSIKLVRTRRMTANGLELRYEVTPARDVTVETVMLDGIVPSEPHAGTTRYAAADVGVLQGVLPRELLQGDYILAVNIAPVWVGFVAANGDALRMTIRGASMQLQDNRKWGTRGFGVMIMAAQGKLAAGKPVRFEIGLEAVTRARIESDTRAAQGGAMTHIRMADSRPLAIRSVRSVGAKPAVYGTVELAVDAAATYDNPFDAAQVSVEADVTQPDGRKVTVPGFYRAPVRFETKAALERSIPDGPGGFRVRVCPTTAGPHRVVVRVTNHGKVAKSKPLLFNVMPTKSVGFVRRSAAASRYFAFDSGKPYFAVGENVCWSGPRTPLAEYKAWLEGLGAAGGNWARLWLAYNEKGMEWMPAPTPKAGTGAYLGLGRYAQDNAARLDEIVRIAERTGVRLMFCFGTYGEFTEGGFFNEGCWISNPYNKANGGPCDKPTDFWTNERARALYKQRLRYAVARWGHSTHVFAWEFWNEVPPNKEQAAWVAEMASYLKQIDPYRHLVSTTYGDESVWKCPSIDFTMTHMYGQAGNTPLFTNQIQSHARDNRPFGKPYLLAEFGIDWQTADSKWDPRNTGVNMHNGAWAAMMSGAAGTAMLWYWDGYVHPGGLYKILTPVRKFADTIDWTKHRLEPIADVGVTIVGGAPETFAPLVIPSTVEWGIPASTEYTILRDGTVRGGAIAMTVGSPARQRGEVPTRIGYRVDLPAASTVTLRLGSVCTGAHLVVKVDGATAVDRVLKAGPMGEGPWKASKLLTQYNCWVSDYDEDIPLELAAGPHEIEITNAAGDWLQIRSISLPAYRSSRYANVDALGLGGSKVRLLWVHHRESTWRTDYDGKKPSELTGVRVSVPAVDGRWQAEWWDAWSGEIVKRETASASAGRLTLDAPAFSRDLALRCTKAETR